MEFSSVLETGHRILRFLFAGRRGKLHGIAADGRRRGDGLAAIRGGAGVSHLVGFPGDWAAGRDQSGISAGGTGGASCLVSAPPARP